MLWTVSFGIVREGQQGDASYQRCNEMVDNSYCPDESVDRLMLEVSRATGVSIGG
ncbi:hypothetical protein Sjap_012424 [Stephania japonica]|uniref:Uncharacterized protein n=1 Tax=Stephania japonica TaxID=461633 RepID=A0AAP0IXX8_9MAGN